MIMTAALSCGDDGIVSRDAVVAVLRKNSVTVIEDGDRYAILREGVPPEVQYFPPHIHRGMLQRLAQRYHIDIWRFYHPSDTLPTVKPQA
jgi:hypothetical protein